MAVKQHLPTLLTTAKIYKVVEIPNLNKTLNEEDLVDFISDSDYDRYPERTRDQSQFDHYGN